MSAGVASLQAQVELVLGALVKAATVELIKLFESGYRAPPDAGRTEDKGRHAAPGGLSTGATTRSIGVQVDEDMNPLCAPPFLSDENLYGKCSVELVEGSVFGTEILLAEDDGQVDPGALLPLEEQVSAETVDMVKLSELKTESPDDPQTDLILHETWTLSAEQSSPAKQKPLVIIPDTFNIITGEAVKFVCPLILKSESQAPKPDISETPVKAEPQQVCVSTAKGTAYSPSPTDGAVTPGPVEVWERTHTPKETEHNLYVKLKRTSPNHELTRPCAVQLVDVLAAPESEARLQGASADGHDANHKTGWPLPKDLRRHHSFHNGHRICCFTPCENGVWRLQKAVSHAGGGYPCGVCGKTFKRRKILRRHERFHTGEKPYPCSRCSKSFALRKSLRRHLRFHTGQRPYTCTHCSKSFRLRENLKAHLRFHTGEKPFSCAICGKKFRILKNLEKHNLTQCGFFVPSFRTIAGL